MSVQLDIEYMHRALRLAEHAANLGEVPVGAVLVKDNKIIGEGYNAPIASSDPTAHAEILAIRAACGHEENYRLPNTTLYVTLEPCAMCAGAIIHARITRLVIAAKEPRAGAAGSALDVINNDKVNHRCSLEFGVLGEQSSILLKSFFKSRR